MSKSDIAVILPSEGDGWEVWSLEKDGIKHVRSLEGAITKSVAKSGDCVAFSSCRVATLPMLVPSADEEIYRGAAQLELENAGLLHDSENYQGWDCLHIGAIGENTFVSGVYLLEEELNEENDLRQYSFDFSARFYSPNLKGDCIAVWKERHKWCLTFYRNNIPFLIEPVGTDSVELGSAVSMLLLQLEMKGIDFHPQEVRLWSETDQQATFAQQLKAINLQLKAEPRPTPSLPEGHIELQPSVASEWRKRVDAVMRLRVLAVALLMFYLIAAGYMWYSSSQQDKKLSALEDELAEYAPAWEANNKHFAEWDELEPLVTEFWPLRMYKDCVMSIPDGQQIRFSDINLQKGFVEIKGSAVGLGAFDVFKPKLRRATSLEDLAWEMRPAVKDSKTARWTFTYNAKPVGSEQY